MKILKKGDIGIGEKAKVISLDSGKHNGVYTTACAVARNAGTNPHNIYSYNTLW